MCEEIETSSHHRLVLCVGHNPKKIGKSPSLETKSSFGL